MTTFCLVVVIFALLGFIGWLLYEQRNERERMLHRIIAKTASEVRVLDNETRHVPVITPKPRPRPDQEDVDTFWDDIEPVGI